MSKNQQSKSNTDMVEQIDDRVRQVETDMAVMKNDMGHVVSSINSLVEQLKDHTSKIAEYILMDRKVLNMENELSSIKSDVINLQKTSDSYHSKIDIFLSFFKNPVVFILILAALSAFIPSIDIMSLIAQLISKVPF